MPPIQDYLTPLRNRSKKVRFATFDIETTTDLSKVYLVGYYDGEKYEYWESEPEYPERSYGAIDKFLVSLFAKREQNEVRLYAHNGGNFDFLYVIRWLLEHRDRYSFEVIPVQSTILYFKVTDKQTKNTWEFVDSLRLMNASLEKLGQAFGLGGKVKDIDYETLHLNPRRYEYLETDCRLLYNCLDRFQTMVETIGADMALTAPGVAMSLFRRRYLKRRIPVTRTAHEFVRKAYYGGRVERYREAYDKSHDPIRVRLGDYNSMYPFAMLAPVPTELVHESTGRVDLQRLASHWLGFVECRVSIPDTCYLPPLPYRSPESGKLTFPIGEFDGVWTSEELLNLKRIGGKILSYGKSLWFKGKPIFAEYVKELYKYRDKKQPNYNQAFDHLAKLLLNSTYGKMGMNELREKLWFFPTDSELSQHVMKPIADIAFGIFSEEVTVNSPYIIPHIAAWITSLARSKLWQTMQGFLEQGYRIWYCDTDSIVTDAPIESSSKLGELKLVCEIARAHFAAPKFYFIEEATGTKQIKAKGFFGGFGQGSMTEADYWKVVKHKEKVSMRRMTKLREGLKEERFPIMKTVEKGLRSGQLDDKRISLPDGNTAPVRV